jgi:uncharacterized protein (TIGR02145 family)
VVATAPCGTSAQQSSTEDITVICPAPAQPGAITFSTSSVKLDGTITASVPEVTGISYEWEFPDNYFTGSSTTNTITLTATTVGTVEAGAITVRAINDLMCNSDPTSSTSAVKICPENVTDSQNNSYPVGTFGNSGCWMTQNMRKTSGLTERTHYYYPNGSYQQNDYTDAHGLLYNWTTANTICPTGWRLPTAIEMMWLWREIDDDTTGKYATETQPIYTGRKAKSVTRVNSGAVATGGTSKSATENGFDWILTGLVDAGVRANYGQNGYMWVNDASSRYGYRVQYDSDIVHDMPIQDISVNSFFPVRCVQD